MSALPQPIRELRNATLADGSRVDVRINGDTVVGVSTSSTDGGTSASGVSTSSTGGGTSASGVSTGSTDGGGILDLDGFVLLTAPAEPHAHLDKALSWDEIAPPMGDLPRAIESWHAYSDVMTTASIADRARAQALAMLRNGTTAIRSHVDLLPGADPLRCVHAMLQVRDELRDLLDLELVTLCTDDMPDAVIEEALDLGIDLVGGAPHLAADPLAELRRQLAIARRRGVGVDLHTDEDLDGEPTILEFARIVRDWTVNVSAGHCVRLGTLEPHELDEVIREVLASDIGVISLPITNLYLQGWQHPVSTPRGLTALRALLDAGVRVAAGADNVRDPFNPVGRSDALETASLLVTAGHLTLDEAYRAVSTGARDVLRLPDAGPLVGARAELLAVRGSSLADAVANGPADRLVIHAGSLVARSTLSVELAPIEVLV